MPDQTLAKQIDFLSELEKLKIVYRKNGVIDQSRAENSAEHSWHIALMALILQDHIDLPSIEISKVIKMLLIHDIIEIDAGDTFLYDQNGCKTKAVKENLAAARIFGMLPEKQTRELTDLLIEFEERKTNESKYAAAIDGLQPLINHYLTARTNDNPNRIKKADVISKKIFIKDVSESLWKFAEKIINKSVDKGLYLE